MAQGSRLRDRDREKMKMTEYTCYTCGTPIEVDMREAYMEIGYGDYVVECDGEPANYVIHTLINIDNELEMAV